MAHHIPIYGSYPPPLPPPRVLNLNLTYLAGTKIREYGKRHSKRGRSSGGISFFAKKRLARDYKILSSDPYRIWLKINKSMYNREEDIIVCILYIPPSDSSWFKKGKSFNFDKLKEEIAFYEHQASSVFIFRDHNARVGTENDYIVSDEINEFLSFPDNYIPDDVETLPRRVSRDQEFDQKGHANEPINFCKSTGYRIANGRIGSDKEKGHFTCYKPNGNSIVDYLLVKAKDFAKISNFEIGEVNEYSDHCYLSLKIKKKNSKCRRKYELANKKFGNTNTHK